MDPNAPVNPAPEAAPEVPVVDPAPAADPVAPVVEEPKLTPEEQADKDSDDEWDAAQKEIFPGIKTQKKDGKDEPAKPEKTPEEIAADEAAAKAKEGDEEQGSSDDPAAKDESNQEDPGAAARAARIAARESAQQVEKVRADVKEKMFADLPEHLQDADGDPIKTIEDVQKLINPRTNELFTEEEAGTWLLAAQQQFNQNRADIEKQIEQIADLNVDIKDQADNVNFKYGAILKADEKLRDELWADYEETLERDPSSGIITKMPMSLEKFYDRALKHRLDDQTPAPAPQAPATPVETPEQVAAREAKEKAEADAKKQKARNERSDIYAPNTDADGAVDAEDKEWGEAAKAVFGERVK